MCCGFDTFQTVLSPGLRKCMQNCLPSGVAWDWEKHILANSHAHWKCNILTCVKVNPNRMHGERLCGRGWQTRGFRLVKSTQRSNALCVLYLQAGISRSSFVTCSRSFTCGGCGRKSLIVKSTMAIVHHVWLTSNHQESIRNTCIYSFEIHLGIHEEFIREPVGMH